MAMEEIVKKREIDKVEKLSSKKLEEKMVEAIDEASEDDTPFLQTTGKEEITILGDPNKISKPDMDRPYPVNFVLPKDEFDKEDYDEKTIIYENDFSFTVESSATQEPVTPFNRTYLSATCIDFLLNFFETNEETGEIDIKTTDDLKRSTVLFFRNDSMVESTKFFVGKLLGIPETLIPYMEDLTMMENGFNLIKENPSLINEAYFTAK